MQDLKNYCLFILSQEADRGCMSPKWGRDTSAFVSGRLVIWTNTLAEDIKKVNKIILKYS